MTYFTCLWAEFFHKKQTERIIRILNTWWIKTKKGLNAQDWITKACPLSIVHDEKVLWALLGKVLFMYRELDTKAKKFVIQNLRFATVMQVFPKHCFLNSSTTYAVCWNN